MWHEEILDTKQHFFLPLLSQIPSEYILVGGTAIALYLGHRKSIDFDFFTNSDGYNAQKIQKLFQKNIPSLVFPIRKTPEEYTFLCQGVKFTFYDFPFPIQKNTYWRGVSIPCLLDLSAMKAFAMTNRSKWKDYVDIYWILSHKLYTISDISKRAKELFDGSFNEKLFRGQLCYFDDVDYSEEVDFIDTAYTKEEIQNTLIEIAISYPV